MNIVSILETAGGIISGMAGAYATIRHLIASSKTKKELLKQIILKEAKLEAEKMKCDLEERIRKLEIELESQKVNIARDMSHMREIYSSEIKVLAEKIENLREDLSQQHSSMVNLLTKLIDNK